MITLLLAAAISCSAQFDIGVHGVTCTAEYLHNEMYTASTWERVVGPGTVTCSGEGHPFKVSMRENGVVVCHNETPIFADGLESGDVGAWSNAVE